MVSLGDDKVRVSVEGRDYPMTVMLGGEGTGEPERRIELASSWWFGEPVWEGTIDGEETAIQVRPILNGVHLTYEGVEAPIRVFTEREAESLALMPVKEKPDTSKFLLCPMPGLVVSFAVEEGQEVSRGRGALRRRSDENGKRAEGGTRRHGVQDPRRAGG